MVCGAIFQVWSSVLRETERLRLAQVWRFRPMISRTLSFIPAV